MNGPLIVLVALAALVLLAFGVDGAIRPHAEAATFCDEPWCALGADDRAGHREAGGCVARDLGAEYDCWHAEHLTPAWARPRPTDGQPVTYPIFDTLADALAFDHESDPVQLPPSACLVHLGEGVVVPAESAPWADPTEAWTLDEIRGACTDPEHFPAGLTNGEPGLHRQSCPTCGKSDTFAAKSRG